MNDILEILYSLKYRIKKLTINNFTSRKEELSLDIYIYNTSGDCKKIHFSKVKNINMDDFCCGMSAYSYVEITDRSDFFEVSANYYVDIDEDNFSFYCDSIEMESYNIEELNQTNLFDNVKLENKDEIYDLLKGKYHILSFTINNFVVATEEDDVSIDISIRSEEYGVKKLHFSPAREIKINKKAYKSSDYSLVTITDISDRQWSEIRYEVCISENIMHFYCRYVEI